MLAVALLTPLDYLIRFDSAVPGRLCIVFDIFLLYGLNLTDYRAWLPAMLPAPGIELFGLGNFPWISPSDIFRNELEDT